MSIPNKAVVSDGKPAPHREKIMRWFKHDHLKTKQANVSHWFCELAEMLQILPPCEERAFALRKLLEAKDCAVRASLSEDEQ